MLPEIFVCAGDEFSTYEKSVPAPLFKKEFYINNSAEYASVTVGCTGFFELWLNGKNITDGYLVPFQANPNKTVFYRKYDLSEKLDVGKNVIYVFLGNGFSNPIGGEVWEQYKMPGRGAPAFALEFSSNEVSFTAEEFLWTKSPLLFDDYRIGTYFDARILKSIEDDECVWNKPKTKKGICGTKRLVDFPPVREVKRLIPKILPGNALRDYRMRDNFVGKLHEKSDIMTPAPLNGGIVYDFGENVAGIPVLKIKNTTSGQKIHMQFTELLFEGFPDYINVDVYPDGCAQQDVYVCCGADEETYSPSFTYHGCRYCYLYGANAEDVSLELAVVRNDVDVRSSFECSEEISNKVFEMCRRSDASNLHNILTDCPHREKNGWTGDAAISAEHFLMGFGAEQCFDAWLCSIRDTQHECGCIPCLVPCNDEISDSVVWDSILFFVPYYCFKYTGDLKIIEDNADAMIKNLKYHLGFRDERGIVERGMGDWLPVNLGAFDSSSPLGFCCTATMVEMCRMGEVMFERIGNREYADFCGVTKKELLSAIHKEYVDGDVITAGRTDKYKKPHYRPCQTSQALGLFFNIFEDCHKKTAAEKLAVLVKENNGSFDCGFLGIRAIFHVLSDYGYSSLAHQMITKPTHPSFANLIYRGETTVCERFMYPGGRIGSHNHHFMAEPSLWYLSDVLGIKVNPDMTNPDNIVINPKFLDTLSFAKGYYSNKNGGVYVEWKRVEGEIILDVQKTGRLSVKIEPDTEFNPKIIYTEKMQKY